MAYAATLNCLNIYDLSIKFKVVVLWKSDKDEHLVHMI